METAVTWVGSSDSVCKCEVVRFWLQPMVLGIGEVYFHARVDGQCWSCISPWEIRSSVNGIYKCLVKDQPVLVNSDTVIEACIYSAAAPGSVSQVIASEPWINNECSVSWCYKSATCHAPLRVCKIFPTIMQGLNNGCMRKYHNVCDGTRLLKTARQSGAGLWAILGPNLEAIEGTFWTLFGCVFGGS